MRNSGTRTRRGAAARRIAATLACSGLVLLAICSPALASGSEMGGVPGPGSWWQWLTGTVVAGLIASGLSLFGLSFKAAPAPPRMPAPPVRGPYFAPVPAPPADPPKRPSESELDRGTAIAGGPSGNATNISNDFRTVPDHLLDKARWFYDGAADIHNSSDALHQFSEWNERVGGLKEHVAKHVTENITTPMLEAPPGELKSILSFELWEKAMEGLLDKGEESAGQQVRLKLKSPPSAWNKAISTPAGKSAANAVWKEQVAAGKRKVQAFEDALKLEGKGSAEAQTETMLDIRRDPLALKNLNDEGTGALRSQYNKGIGRLQESALGKARLTLAEELKVPENQVRIIRATNRRTGVKAKYDLDFTYQQRAGGEWVDVPLPKAQQHFDEALYEVVGRLLDITAEELSKSLRCKAVAGPAAEALGFGREGMGLELKANESLLDADRLAAAGDIAGANVQRWLGQRQLGEAFDNQIMARVESLRNQGRDTALTEEKIANIESAVREMIAMQKTNASPADIGAMLRDRGWQEERLAKRIREIHEERA